MEEVRLIDIRKIILSENDDVADLIRKTLKQEKVFMINLMASPGAGKTSLVLETIRRLTDIYKIGVIEGDIDSIIDAEKVVSENIPAVQLRTGGACHLDASMIDVSLHELDLSNLDLVIIENIGNLVNLKIDAGANIKVMISSVPEGDDKVLKYPLMFSVCDVLIVNKIDYLPDPGFNVEVFKKRVTNLNPSIKIFELSCRTGHGVDEWINWLSTELKVFKGKTIEHEQPK